MQPKVVKQQGTQDFFPRSANNQKTKGFIFNKAPINKREAQNQLRETLAEKDGSKSQKKNKRSAFMAKLYDEDENAFEDEMKVFDMDAVSDNENEMDEAKVNKRTEKTDEKMSKKKAKGSGKASVLSGNKINRLKFSTGSLGLFAISEVHPRYLIVNYTRNTKGFVSLDGKEELSKKFEIGQFIVASVISRGTAKYNTETSGNRNKKLQLTIDLDQLNKSLTADTLTVNMTLQGELESKEAKGYLINFGLKDKTKGFLPFTDETNHLQIGSIIKVVIKSVLASSKVVKCELLQTADITKSVMTSKEITIHNLKPGFLVNGKITKLVENGIELSFLGGFTGTIFIDHLDKVEPTKYKVGEKIISRIIAVDPQTQTISLSTLPHIVKITNIKKQLIQEGVQVGNVYEKATVEKQLYGGSFRVSLGKDLHGFLHKIHTHDAKSTEEESETDKKKSKEKEIEVGQKLTKMRVKEINYFDGVPILSLRDDVVNSSALNYKNIKCGDFISATITEVNEQGKFIQLDVNDFVKGRLYIEHMADYPLKVIPPKYRDVGKQIKVRVFGVNPEARSLEFTRKETLMKAKVPVFQSYREVNKGTKLYGVIVGENEYGYIIKTFGGIKCFLTFQEIKEHTKTSKKDSQYKFGSIVKAYVLFKKKDQGMALTLDKTKAKELRKENSKDKNNEKKDNEANQSLESYLPKEEEIDQIKEKYKTFIKASQDKNNIGKVLQFRVLESNENYFICKSLDAPKKSQNIISILPTILINKLHKPSFNIEDFTFQALVLELQDDFFPLISAQQDLISLKDQIPKSNAELNNEGENRIFTGLVNETTKNGVQIRFLDGLKKQVIVKDLETVQNFQEVYTPGKVARVALNKLGRLCLKDNVIYLQDQENIVKDKEIQITSFYQEIKSQLNAHEISIGDKVNAEVSLVKDYGLIVAVEKYPGLTGFVLTEHQISGKSYKEGQKIKCRVMDIDFEKEIVDLSERLVEKKSGKSQKIKKGQTLKAIVELNKEEYLIISFKQNRKQIGLLKLQSFNNDKVPNPNEKYNIDDELDVKVVDITEEGFVLTIPVLSQSQKQTQQSSSKNTTSVNLTAGVLVNATIKSKKHDCLFLQIQQQSQLVIGRLHRIECQSNTEFESFSVGESVQAKILKISHGKIHCILNFIIDDKKTWIELTRRKEHMKRPQGLDDATLQSTYQSMEDLKNGKEYDAIITDVNYAYSFPIQISLSPFVRGQIAFDKILSPETLIQEGTSILQKYKPGAQVKVTYNNGIFQIYSNEKKGKLQKGDKLVVRFVKAVNGKGITVQINEKTFGFIEICEITDDVIGSVCNHQLQTAPLFVARVIGFEKGDKPMLSSRDSVIDDTKWALIGPDGKSIHFQKFDEKNQKLGNQRNKIYKYGANVALQQNDLCMGYIVNIGKSGCFVQLGHKTTARAGLNELSDDSSFDFKEQMPLGRLVLTRIVKVDERGEQKRFNLSLRKSLVVFGTNTIDKSDLQTGNDVSVIIMAIADGKVFGQVKGSYHKLKIKGLQKGQVKVGDNVMVKLTKVTKQKITGTFVEKLEGSGLTQHEKQIDKLWNTIEEEAQKDIEDAAKLAEQAEEDANLFKNLGNAQDEIEEQIQDLNALENDDEDMEIVQGDDSDVEEMQRIIKESKVYEDNDDEEDEEDEDMEDVEEEEDDEEVEEDSNEDSDEEMKDESSEEEKVTKTKSGKQSLKQRIKEEQEIRKREQELKENKNIPSSIDDFERLLVQNQDQSYVWIQYMAFMIDKLGIESARKVAERAVKSVSISNEEDKFNLWIAYMNLENNFGTQETLEQVIKRALEVNDRKKIYLQLISIYQASQKYQYIEDIFRVLAKKYNTSFKIWSSYLEFLFQMRDLKKDKLFIVKDLTFSEPKQILQKALQTLPKDKHVNIISKFGQLEFKHGQPESGRTMMEGIVNNYPKRMDIWAIYMDMESKYCGENKQQARHLFERCLANEYIQKKPKKMKLVFQKYMEFEMHNGNKKNVDKLRQRVEDYLEKVFNKDKEESDSE